MCNPPITEDERELQLLDIVDQISDLESIVTPGTPQEEAFTWLVNLDGAQVCPEDTLDVINRYVLAVLYFSTSGDGWFQCNANDSAVPSMCISSNARFLSEASVCEWFGVVCDLNGNVTIVELGKCVNKTTRLNQKAICLTLHSILTS